MARKTLYNTYSDNVCGRCKLKKCDLTVKQVRAKKCLQKNCWHLEKNEEHPWWGQRETLKQKKKDRKKSLTVLNYNV